MVHVFDAEKRSEFFDKTFAPTQLDLLNKGEITHLHPRDEILLNILAQHPANARILDYGCGQGRLLGELLNRGYDAYGYEPSQGMGDIATTHFVSPDRIYIGSEDVLSAFAGEKYDLVLLMGVMQYLSDDERSEVLERVKSYLKPGGTLIATFQNGLFDLFTFNKYTVDAVTNMLLAGQLSEQEALEVERAVGGLLTQPEAPAHSEWRARDNIFVRLENPLTVADYLSGNGFSMEHRWFYEWFGVPPLLSGPLGDIGKRIKSTFEVVNADDWRGHFLANAFLVTAKVA